MDSCKKEMVSNNYYKILGVNEKATKNELKAAYRTLAKKYHPDTGGNNEKFLTIQIAWETLNDPIKKEKYDKLISYHKNSQDSIDQNWAKDLKSTKKNSSVKDNDIKLWIKKVYSPINNSLNQIIKPLNNEIKKLSADPYDDDLMEEFCNYILKSKKKIERISLVYKSQAVPEAISGLGLDLYHAFSQAQDALEELDRYTQGYVDDYLFDGKEMMKEAKRIQTKMLINKKNISF